jgi:hypothetical protein
MAQSTTEVNALDCAFWLDNAAGTLKDCSGSSNAITLAINAVAGIVRNFQNRWPNRFDGIKDASINFTITYSTAADEALDLLRDWWLTTKPGKRTVKLYIPDKNVGSDVYSGEFTPNGDLNIPSVADQSDPITVTGTLAIHGALTHTTATT